MWRARRILQGHALDVQRCWYSQVGEGLRHPRSNQQNKQLNDEGRSRYSTFRAQ